MTHNVLRIVRSYRVGDDRRTDTSWDLVAERKPRQKAEPTPAQILSKIRPEPNKQWTLDSKPRLVGKPREWSVESLHAFAAKHGGL